MPAYDPSCTVSAALSEPGVLKERGLALMSMRTLYLQRFPSSSGRDSLAGRQLFDLLEQESDDSLLRYWVLPDDEADRYHSRHLGNDIVPSGLIKRLNPNLIYVKGGVTPVWWTPSN